jgi:aldose 1-epimerase
MLAFENFAPPVKRINLQLQGFRCEVWPELGGALARFTHQDTRSGRVRHLFRPATDVAPYQPLDLASWPLLPYSNRIRDGSFSFAGRGHKLPRNFAAFKHPTHGIGWLRPWQTLAVHEDRCELRLTHAGDAHWPFAFAATQIIRLTATGVQLEMTLHNLGSEPMPYGLGQHPYFPRPPGTSIQTEVSGVWQNDAEFLPINRTAIPAAWDMRNGCLLDEVFIDNCFDGYAGKTRLIWPDGGEILMTSSANLGFLVIYNPVECDYVCIEPVSHMPDAFNFAARAHTHTGHAVLAPDESVTVTHCFDYQAPQTE